MMMTAMFFLLDVHTVIDVFIQKNNVLQVHVV